MTATKPCTVVKIGGALLNDERNLDVFWQSIRTLQERQAIVVVHGGGPQATEMARRLGHEPRIVHGRRVTTDLDLDIMKWTVRGELNVNLTAHAIRFGVPAVGLSGVDGSILKVVKRPPWEVEGEKIDFGHVGDVVGADTRPLSTLIDAGYVPVVAPLGVDENGRIYNVNADTVACSIAGALKASNFLLVAESGGLLRDPERPDSRIATCDPDLYHSGIEGGWIKGGMRVKIQIGFEALDAGVENVYVLAPDDLITRNQGTRITR